MILQKKVCMLGSFGVGKTSLVSQFVHSVFSEQYITTIGVRIDRKQIQVDDVILNLVLWDLAGEDRFDHLQTSYLAGASAFFLVIDGCRMSTLKHARRIMAEYEKQLSPLPFIAVVNKSDLRHEWELTDEDLEEMRQLGWEVAVASSKEAEAVESLFRDLSRQIVQHEIGENPG